MIVIDLDRNHFSAAVHDDCIVLEGQLRYLPEDFIFSDLRIISYSESEERELMRIGLLVPIPRGI